MTSKKTLLAGGLGLLVAGFAVAFPMFQDVVDYSKLPPNPSEVAAQLEMTKVDLATAVKTAEEKANGRAKSASYVFDAEPPAIEVMVFGAESGTRVHVDVVSGEVIKAETLPAFSLPGAPVEGTAMTTDSGLMYYDIVVGDGAQPTPTSRVKVHYSGWLVDGTKFDSSVDRGEPITFPLNGVIRGWTEGVGSMQVGGKRKLLIPYQLAYGERGRPGAIPPRAMLVFDVELLEIEGE
jgi:hypothetical protein